MTNFGTLEYVMDKFSGTWSWKVTGERAVAMVSRIIPQSWYGDGEYEAIVPDDPKNVAQIKWIMDRYPLEILSKNVWQKKLPPSAKVVPKKPKKTERLQLANPGKQFKGNLLNFQREGLDFLLKSAGNALLADEMGLGKCVMGDSIIQTDSGQMQIQDLWNDSTITEKNDNESWAELNNPVMVQTFDGKKITTKKVDKIFQQKINEDIITLTLWDGSIVECTKRHQFLTADGWKKAGELELQDKVAVPSQTIHVAKNDLTPELAELMAWQLAEGYEYFEGKYAHGRFYNSDDLTLSRVTELASKNGISLLPAKKEKTASLIHTTQFYKLFIKWGYSWGNKSSGKIIPQCIFESSLESQKAFVQAMFDAEGHVGKTHCEFVTASHSIAYGMRNILRHFGVWVRIRISMKGATNGTNIKRPYYVCTFGGNSIERFVTQFKLLTPRKQHALEELAKKTHNTNIEGIPSQKIVQKIANSGISLRSLNLFTPYKYTQGMSKNLAYLVIDKLESANQTVLADELRQIAMESINWCKIKSITTKNHNGSVYDLSVPQTHNYIVNGIISHNTVQSLSYLASEKNAFPVLIVAPLVTLQNWQREIEKFMMRKSRNGRLVEDQPPTSTIIRVGKSEDLGKYDFYIINYELLFKRYKDLAKLNLRAIVCDEVQNLRSKTTQKYHAIKKLAALESVRYRVGLSGTPIYNRGSEIWPIVDILRPGLLGSFKEFCEYFCYINEKGKAIVLENKRESLRNMLQKHVMLRRKKSDVLSELKEKIRYKEIIDSDINYYNKELERIWKKLEDERKEAQTAFDASSAYQRAIQSERQAAGAAKLPHVINFVKNIMEIEESVVVFCHHKSIHSLLHESLSEFKPASIIGGQSDKQRQDSIDAFQGGQTKLMIAGLRAGNVGINLTRAKYVIFAELDWSPAIHLQAEDRLHRIGQKNTVFAYYLIGNGTLDEHVARVLVDKSYEIDAIMDNKVESFENKEKAELILAQIQDKVKSILRAMPSPAQ